MKQPKVEIIPTKHRLGGKNVGQRGLFVHPDAAKIHVEIVKDARYVTAADEPKPVQQYLTREMTAQPTSRRQRRAFAGVDISSGPAVVVVLPDYKAE